eukprot:COSAG01_NODE_12123_length_1797_cov_26.290342_1_plen_299_part_00
MEPWLGGASVLGAMAVAAVCVSNRSSPARPRGAPPLSSSTAPPETSLVAESSLPLSGRRIVVTAPRNYAGRLIEQLLKLGARPLWMPMITTGPLVDNSELDGALRLLAADASSNRASRAYAYVAFTSRNGIDAFINRARALGLAGDLRALLRGCTVCALGKDAQALEAAGVDVGLLPSVSSPAGIVRELKERPHVRGARILVPVPVVSGVREPNVVPNFIASLEALEMDVHRVPAYATAAVLAGNDVEEELLLAGKVDAIAFSSTAEATALAKRLGKTNLATLASRTAVCCFGPVTAR